MYDIMTIGTATQDVFLKSPLFANIHDPRHLKKLGFLDGNATCFMPGAKIEIEAPVFATGGGATNAAVTFARTGLRTAVIGKVGIDDGGERIIAECKSEGIASRIIIDKKLRTAYSTILVPLAGERTVLTHRGASDKLKAADINRVAAKSRWIYIAPGNIPYQTIMYTVNLFSKQGSFIALNPSRHIAEKGLLSLKPLLAKIDILILNKEEAAAMTGADYGNVKNILSVLRSSFKGILAVTDGANGSFVIAGARQYDCGIFPKKTFVDATGAGDAYGSGFVSSLIHAQKTNKRFVFSEIDILEAIRIAAANSASVVEHVGAKHGILTQEAILRNPRWKKLSVTVSSL